MRASILIGYSVVIVTLLTASGLIPLDQRGMYFVLLLWLLSMSGLMFALLVTTVSELAQVPPADPRAVEAESDPS